MRAILILSSVVFLLGSCIKNNPDPSWIEVNDWQLIANPDAQYPTGELTENITDAWVYVDNELIGVFEVPFKIPVLLDGGRELKIYPAVKNNGISATKKIYPFLEPFVTDVNLVMNEVVTVTPVTQYYKSIQFWIEDFEDASFAIADGNGSLASLVRTSDANVLNNNVNGAFFGRIALNETNNTYIGSTTANNQGSLVMDLPRGQEVYLEIDYHTTSNLVTGVLAINSSGIADNPMVQINGQDASEVQWRKIYIDLREVVSGSTDADYFEFSFNAELESGVASGEINIDNIKAVYF